MASGGIITTNGKNWLLNRGYKATTDYDEIYYLKLGIGTTTPVSTDTTMEIPVPISNGTINDNGDNALTGSDGGTNTTDNATTYKQGGGVTDNTSQNLIKNGTNATAIWTIADLDTEGNDITSTDYVSLWLYIKDDTALAKLKSSGTCFEAKFGEDASNYYSITKEASDLSAGWNWIYSWPDTVADLTETGTVTGDLDTFILEITTNNSTDELVAGDAIYDLLHCYTDTELVKSIEASYPTFNTTNKTVSTRFKVFVTEANGFDITEVGVFSKDATPIMISHDVIDGESKTTSDEFRFNTTDEV